MYVCVCFQILVSNWSESHLHLSSCADDRSRSNQEHINGLLLICRCHSVFNREGEMTLFLLRLTWSPSLWFATGDLCFITGWSENTSVIWITRPSVICALSAHSPGRRLFGLFDAYLDDLQHNTYLEWLNFAVKPHLGSEIGIVCLKLSSDLRRYADGFQSSYGNNTRLNHIELR